MKNAAWPLCLIVLFAIFWNLYYLGLPWPCEWAWHLRQVLQYWFAYIKASSVWLHSVLEKHMVGCNASPGETTSDAATCHGTRMQCNRWAKAHFNILNIVFALWQCKNICSLRWPLQMHQAQNLCSASPSRELGHCLHKHRFCTLAH